MTAFETSTIIVAIASLIISCLAVVTSYLSNKSNKEIAKRQGVIELHAQWSAVNNIDLNEIITPDIIKAVNALSLTASLWNHNVILKPIIHESYWESYRILYEKLYSYDKEIKGTGRTGRSMVSNNIAKAYHSMNGYK